MVGAFTFRTEAISRGARMLRTALGPAIAAWLEDPGVVEGMLNPDGRLWVDRLTEGLIDTGERLAAADGERIVRLVAHHVAAEVHSAAPRVSAELPETGERFEGLLPPVVAAPAFAIRKPAVAVFTLDDYVIDISVAAGWLSGPAQVELVRSSHAAEDRAVVGGVPADPWRAPRLGDGARRQAVRSRCLSLSRRPCKRQQPHRRPDTDRLRRHHSAHPPRPDDHRRQGP